MEMTNGRGPDSCIDAVGAEANGAGSFDAIIDRAKSALRMTTGRAHALREAIMCCRKVGTLSIPGVHIEFPDKKENCIKLVLQPKRRINPSAE